MPWYRINGMMVHIRGTKLPKACAAVIKLADGRKEYCGQMSGYLCDWPTDASARAGVTATCDLALCDEHRTQAGTHKDFCPDHAALAEHRQPGLFTGLTT